MSRIIKDAANEALRKLQTLSREARIDQLRAKNAGNDAAEDEALARRARITQRRLTLIKGLQRRVFPETDQQES